MLKKMWLAFIAGMFLFNAVEAEDLINCKNPSEWEGMVKLNNQVKHSGDSSFELYGKYPTELVCKQMISIDFNKTYKLSGWMRTLDKQLPASCFFGLRMYDKDKKPININNVYVIPATATFFGGSCRQKCKRNSYR